MSRRAVLTSLSLVYWLWCHLCQAGCRVQPELLDQVRPRDERHLVSLRWRSPSDLFGPTLKLVAAAASRKPLWIKEAGCSDRGGDKATWVADLIAFVKSTKVEGLVWFEANKEGEPDWRLTSHRQTSAAAKQALSDW